jgi:hypothetical protein
MIHDGALPMVGKAEEEHALDRRAKVLLRGIIWWFNTNKLNVSLLNRIEFRDSKVCPDPLLWQMKVCNVS